MARFVRYHPAFEVDVVAAAEWYDERVENLGSEFVACVWKAASELLVDPDRRTAVDYGLRYWPVERFPYVVFYDFTDFDIIVLGVMHTSQSPDKWRKRRGTTP